MEEPEWQNEVGRVVDEGDAVGCKVTHRIDNPDMILMMDEVGACTSQKGDGPIGGEKQVCEAGTVPKEIANTKATRLTTIGLTSASGEPVMCVIIFSGKNRIPLMETGMDVHADVEGVVDDDDFFEKKQWTWEEVSRRSNMQI